MLSAVVHKETRHHLVSFRFLVSTALTVILAVLATVTGMADHAQRRESHLSRLEQYRQDLRQASVYSYLRPVVVRPPEPLAILDRGFEGRLGDEVAIDVYTIPAAATGVDRGNPYLASYQGFDLTTIVRVVLGLQALLLTFDAFVGEREKRTLELVLAQGVERSTLVVGKYLGALAASLSALLLAVLASLPVVVPWGGVEIDAQERLRLVATFAAYGGYLSLMVLIGLALSLRVRRAAQSLAYAILVWLVLVFLVPSVAVATTAELQGPGSEARDAVARLERERDQRFAAALAGDPLRTERNAHRAPYEISRQRAKLLRYGSHRYYDSVASYYRTEIALGRQYAERIFEIRRRADHELRAASRVADVLASLSPAVLLERLSESFAGTSVDDHDDFLAACREYRREVIAYLEERQAFRSWRWFTDDPPETRPWTALFGVAPEDVDPDEVGALAERYRSPEVQLRQQQQELGPAPRLDLAGLPVFHHRQPTLAHAFRRVALEVGLLLIFHGFLAVAVLWRFRRYELRAVKRWSLA